MNSVSADHITYIDEYIRHETDNVRLWDIFKMKPMCQNTWEYCRNISMYLFYKRMLGCKYNAPTERKIKEINQ